VYRKPIKKKWKNEKRVKGTVIPENLAFRDLIINEEKVVTHFSPKEGQVSKELKVEDYMDSVGNIIA